MLVNKSFITAVDFFFQNIRFFINLVRILFLQNYFFVKLQFSINTQFIWRPCYNLRSLYILPALESLLPPTTQVQKKIWFDVVMINLVDTET